jgi:hypothetical protein
MTEKNLHDTLPHEPEGADLKAAQDAERDRLARDLYELDQRLEDHAGPFGADLKARRDRVAAELAAIKKTRRKR